MTSLEPPIERKANLAWRVNILRKAREDQALRAIIKEKFHRDPLFAFKGFFYTYDPRKRPLHNLPFITWDFQDETIQRLVGAITEGRDILIEKSRDMGASWMVIMTFLWCWLDPRGGADFLLGSRIEDYVDKKGDMRTLFEKARYGLYKLPTWLRPRGFQKNKHDNYMRLINPETGAVISGESNNANFSTGGRYAAVLLDEFAKWESTDESAWTAAGDATKCRLPVSTPFGAGGQYYNLVVGGKTEVIRLHWSLHPEKALGVSCLWPPKNEETKEELGESWEPEVTLTSPWYEKECKRRSATEIAQELDINYLGAGNPVFDGKCGDSLAYYLGLPDKPIKLLSLNLEELSASAIPSVPPDPEDWEAHLVVYEEFNRDDEYATGWDIVEGVEGGDYMVGTVLNRITSNVAAVYWSRYDEILAAKVIYVVQDVFSPEPESSDAPWCGIETTGPGLATFDKAVDLGVTNLFMAPRYEVTSGGVSFKKGWKTTASSKAELVGGIKKYLLQRRGKLRSRRLVGELLSFVRTKTGKAQAKAGCHDDMVMSFGIALQVDEIAPLDGDRSEKRKLAAIKASRKSPVVPVSTDERELLKIEEPLGLEARCLASHRAKIEEFEAMVANEF